MIFWVDYTKEMSVTSFMTETYDHNACTIVVRKHNIILTKAIYNAFRNWRNIFYHDG